MATLMLFVISLVACAHSQPKKAPDFVYMGDPVSQGLISNTNAPNISCKDPKFADMVCLDQAEYFDQCVVGQGR